MKINRYIYLLLIVLISINTSYPQEEKTDSKNKTYSVVVMPFYDNQHYPYPTDVIRESFINGLRVKGFHVLTDDPTWSKILDEEEDYNLYNLTTEKAEEIAKSVGADLIVFGYATPVNFIRNPGSYSEKIIDKPVLIKIYDVKKNSLVIYDRSNIYKYDGMLVTVDGAYDVAINIAHRLKTMGY